MDQQGYPAVEHTGESSDAAGVLKADLQIFSELLFIQDRLNVYGINFS